MIIAISGITAVGKTYCVNKIKEKYNFRIAKTIRTRNKRNDEKHTPALFLSKQEIDKLKKKNELLYSFEVFDNTYAYLRKDMCQDDNIVFEMYYTTIFDWKKLLKNLVTIYIFPKDVSIANMALNNRNISSKEKKLRVDDSYEQLNRMKKDKKLFNMFDYIVYNNYDENLINDVSKIIEKLTKE